MRRKMWASFVVTLLGVLLPLKVLAAPQVQTGSVHLGSFTLGAGKTALGDQVVFGGPALLEEGSVVKGDLTVFGSLVMEVGARVEGQVVVTGSADVAGTVHGDLFCAGTLILRSPSVVEGDVSSTGTVEQEEGAMILGDLLNTPEEPAWSVELPSGVLDDFSVIAPEASVSPWIRGLLRSLQGIAFVLVMGLLSLVIVSLWPTQVESIGHALDCAPLTAFGMGLLALILASLGGGLLFLTICLSPVALLLMVGVGAALLLGWVGFSTMLGQKLLGQVLQSRDSNPAVAAVTGSLILSLAIALSQVWAPVHALLLALLVPALAGGVTLTKFGTQPYPARPATE